MHTGGLCGSWCRHSAHLFAQPGQPHQSCVELFLLGDSFLLHLEQSVLGTLGESLTLFDLDGCRSLLSCTAGFLWSKRQQPCFCRIVVPQSFDGPLQSLDLVACCRQHLVGIHAWIRASWTLPSLPSPLNLGLLGLRNRPLPILPPRRRRPPLPWRCLGTWPADHLVPSCGSLEGRPSSAGHDTSSDKDAKEKTTLNLAHSESKWRLEPKMA